MRFYLLFLLVFSSIHAASVQDFFVEAEIIKVEKKWTSNPLTGLPMRVMPYIFLKIHKVAPMKRKKIENDQWEIGKNATVIGKGYELIPGAEPDQGSPEASLYSDWKNTEKVHKISWSGGPSAEKFILRALKFWNSWKGKRKLRAALELQTYQKDGETKVHTGLRPAQIQYGDKFFTNYNYREFFDEEGKKNHKFETLHQ